MIGPPVGPVSSPRNWIQVGKGPVDNSKASWADFFSTDGEFDVYRYQSFIFALVVGGALIAAGVSQLSTFTIPDTILGIVGLSQAVYIAGKLVTRTNMADLNGTLYFSAPDPGGRGVGLWKSDGTDTGTVAIACAR